MSDRDRNPTILFAGLGAMGYGMAAHLLRSGFPLIGYDVYRPSMQKLVSECGAASADSPREAAAARDVDVMIVMVANDEQAGPLLFDPGTGAVGGLKEGAVIIVCSTVAPAFIVEVSVRLEELGRADVGLVDCPVSGGATRAAEGTLSLFSSSSSSDDDDDDDDGERKALSAPRVQSILACLSDDRKLYHVPGGLGAGSKAKLIHQVFAGVHIAVASEVMGLAATAGLDTQEVFEEVMRGEGASFIFGHRVPYMLDPGLGRYSAVTIIAKDVGIVSRMARVEKFPLPLLGLAEQLFLSAIANGWGSEDDCVVVRLYLNGRPGLVVERAGRPVVRNHGCAGRVPGITASEIQDLLVGVQLAVMSEAMAFCEILGIDTELMYDIVSNAAGASRGFQKKFRDMKENRWVVKGVQGGEGIRDRLVSFAASSTYSMNSVGEGWANTLFYVYR